MMCSTRREVGDEEEEEVEVSTPSPIQHHSAFTRPLPSSASLLYTGPPAETRNGTASLITQHMPRPVSSYYGASSAAGKSVSGPGSATAIATAVDVAAEQTEAYRECLRNHAASLGGHVLDGCCEFMPRDEDALRCAACGCHRSFHRKEINNGDPVTPVSCLIHHNGAQVMRRLPPPLPQGAPQSYYYQQTQFGARPFAAAGSHYGVLAMNESSSEEMMNAGVGGSAQLQALAGTKKRSRTKFTAEQKEKMLAFAESAGWRIQKQDEVAVQQFCNDVGISRQVLKVWMHNNKSTRKQEELHQDV